MEPFIVVNSNKFEPLPIVVQLPNPETPEKGVEVRFTIKHVADWPGSSLEEYSKIYTQWTKLDSLLKSQKKKMTGAQSMESLRISLAMNNLLLEYGIVEDEGKAVWKILPTHVTAQINEGWKQWTEKTVKEEKK